MSAFLVLPHVRAMVIAVVAAIAITIAVLLGAAALNGGQLISHPVPVLASYHDVKPPTSYHDV